MSSHLIQALIPFLPRFAEEEGDFYAVKRDDLIHHLCDQTNIDPAVAENTVSLCEVLLDSLATLDAYYLKQGEWCFVSFPAQLMALSVLNTLSDKDSTFFANVPHFWTTNSISAAKKEQQYLSLKHFEERRDKLHVKNTAAAIRFIHVAWALIKVDDHILFYQREDTKKRYDKKAGDYGLVGGRVNQFDFANEGSIGEMKEILPILQSADIKQIKTVVEKTLIRELEEETGLEHDTHYRYKNWRELKPYQQAQGAAPNYAITDYFITVFSIELTLEGLCFLHNKVKQDERLIWFSIEDMAKGQSADGKIAFIKALVNDYKDDSKALETDLLALEPSFKPNYRCINESGYKLILAKCHGADFVEWIGGKEKHSCYINDINMDAVQFGVLMGLAAYQRACTFSSLNSGLILHPYGWVEVSKASGLQQAAKDLSEQFNQDSFCIENWQDRYFRLSVAPDNLFFHDSFFSWSSDAESKSFVLNRASFATALGMVAEKEIATKITPQMAINLQNLANNQRDKIDDKSVRDTYRKSPAVELEKTLGLNRLIKEKNKKIELCCAFLRRPF